MPSFDNDIIYLSIESYIFSLTCSPWISSCQFWNQHWVVQEGRNMVGTKILITITSHIYEVTISHPVLELQTLSTGVCWCLQNSSLSFIGGNKSLSKVASWHCKRKKNKVSVRPNLIMLNVFLPTKSVTAFNGNYVSLWAVVL